ncbi:MAG: hypothetical protein ABL984_17080, partial [Pyrinomonadaceae bacterium]
NIRIPTHNIPPPILLSGEELFRHLMGPIEPELLIENADSLVQKYSNETPEQTKNRSLRYIEAFRRYNEEYAKYTAQIAEEVTMYLQNELQGLEQQTKAQEAALFTQIEQLMSN